ncbi:hypothetical protein R1sor_012383 [Riccia sorocarpa]|uniref:Ubiquitin-like protease family profile domain-containing protein n=1 Tax=Riccia sorocarpa TaxID=122646 RepID=A0ABD3I7M1_9MARC
MEAEKAKVSAPLQGGSVPYVNPSDKSEVQPLITGLDRPELDANEFLQQVQHANSDYKVTSSRQTRTDYLEEIGDRTQARLKRETSIRGNGPTTRAQSRRLFVQAEEPADPQPQELQPVETHTEEAVEEILTPSTEPTAHEEVASTEPTMDVGSIPAEVAKDPDVKDIGGPSSPGLHMQVYAPKVLHQPSEVVEIGNSPASGRDTRDPLDDWKSYEQLMKKDLEYTNPKRFIRGDVINMYIKEKFLVQPRSELEGKFFVNTFWFAQLNALNKQVLSGNLARSVEKIHRLRKGITPRVDDVQDIRTLFVPIHFGKGDFHWSLVVIHFGTSRCTIYHLDNALGTHNTTDVCAVLSLFVTIALKIPLEKISVGSYFTPQQRGNHECGYHVMQFLSKVAKVKGDLRPYFDDESACRFANVGDVDSFQLIFGMYMDPKGWTAKNLKRRVLP